MKSASIFSASCDILWAGNWANGQRSKKFIDTKSHPLKSTDIELGIAIPSLHVKSPLLCKVLFLLVLQSRRGMVISKVVHLQPHIPNFPTSPSLNGSGHLFKILSCQQPALRLRTIAEASLKVREVWGNVVQTNQRKQLNVQLLVLNQDDLNSMIFSPFFSTFHDFLTNLTIISRTPTTELSQHWHRHIHVERVHVCCWDPPVRPAQTHKKWWFLVFLDFGFGFLEKYNMKKCFTNLFLCIYILYYVCVCVCWTNFPYTRHKSVYYIYIYCYIKLKVLRKRIIQ